LSVATPQMKLNPPWLTKNRYNKSAFPKYVIDEVWTIEV